MYGNAKFSENLFLILSRLVDCVHKHFCGVYCECVYMGVNENDLKKSSLFNYPCSPCPSSCILLELTMNYYYMNYEL